MAAKIKTLFDAGDGDELHFDDEGFWLNGNLIVEAADLDLFAAWLAEEVAKLKAK